MRAVTWNMGCGYGHKFRNAHAQAWSYLKEELDPDLAMLQEVGELPAWLSDDQVIRAPRNHGGNFSTVLYSKSGGLLPVAPPPKLADLLDGQAVMGLLPLGSSRPSLVASVHAKTGLIDQAFLDDLPADVRQWFPETADREFWHMVVILAAIEATRRQRRRLVVGGDFNLALRLDEVHGPGSSHWGSGQFFDWARRCGWRRAHLKFHAGEVRTLFRKPKELDQLDHFFVDESTYKTVDACEVLTPPALEDLCDHAPLCLSLTTSHAPVLGDSGPGAE